MVASAQWCEVVSGGWSAVGVRDHVVGVAVPGRVVAPREHAGEVAFGSLVVEAVGDLVGTDVHALVEVQDRLHGDEGVGVGAPVADLVGGDDL